MGSQAHENHISILYIVDPRSTHSPYPPISLSSSSGPGWTGSWTRNTFQPNCSKCDSSDTGISSIPRLASLCIWVPLSGMPSICCPVSRVIKNPKTFFKTLLKHYFFYYIILDLQWPRPCAYKSIFVNL